MYTEGFEQWFKLNKNLANPLNECSKTMTEICRRSVQNNLEMIGENITRFSDQLKRCSNIRKPEELASVAKECLDENLTAFTENMRKLAQNTMENVEELNRIWSTTASKATEHAVEKAQKFAEKAEKYEK